MKKFTYLTAFAAMWLAACTSMDDNYIDYVERHTTYAQKLSISETGYMSVPEEGAITLYWTLPLSDRLKGVEIIHKETEEKLDTVKLGLVEEYTFHNLPVQSHDFYLYTVDEFDNLSVPVSVTLIPLTDRNGDAERKNDTEE